VYLRATFASAGTYPNILPANPRAAFRDFEAAARAGHAPAWFRLARDYEAFNDTAHAIDCLNRGAKVRFFCDFWRCPALPCFGAVPWTRPRHSHRDGLVAARALCCVLSDFYRPLSDSEQLINCATHARTQARDPAALHRLGTAHLLGQLGLQVRLFRACLRKKLQQRD
jgi:hypothetical protein